MVFSCVCVGILKLKKFFFFLKKKLFFFVKIKFLVLTDEPDDKIKNNYFLSSVVVWIVNKTYIN